MNFFSEYNTYLKNRSLLGLIYRRFILYPKLKKYVKGKVLDVGCGIGDFLAFYENSIGVDINEFNVSTCRQKNLKAYLYSYKDINLYIKKFDTIVLDNVIEHIDNPNEILSFVMNISKKNGLLLIGVPGERGFKKDSDHKVFYSKDDLVTLLKSYNFKMVDEFYMPINSNKFSRVLSQHCLYCLFKFS